jgi:hypothetical protein
MRVTDGGQYQCRKHYVAKAEGNFVHYAELTLGPMAQAHVASVTE